MSSEAAATLATPHSNYSRWDKVDWELLLKDDDKATERSDKREHEKARKRKRERAQWKSIQVESSERAVVLHAQAGVAAILARKPPPQFKLLDSHDREGFSQATRARALVLHEAANTHSTCAAHFSSALQKFEKACAALRSTKTSADQRVTAVSCLQNAASLVTQLLRTLPQNKSDPTTSKATHDHGHDHHHHHDDNGHCCGGKHDHKHENKHGLDNESKSSNDERLGNQEEDRNDKQNDALAELNKALSKLCDPAQQLQDEIAVALANAHVEDGRALDAVYVLRDVLVRTRGCEDAWVARALAFFCMDAPLLAELHLIQPQVNVEAKFPHGLLAKIRARVRRRQAMPLRDQVQETIRSTRLPPPTTAVTTTNTTTTGVTSASSPAVPESQSRILSLANSIITLEINGNRQVHALQTADHLLEMSVALSDESFYHSAHIKALAAAWLALHATSSTLKPFATVDVLDDALADHAVDTLVHALVAAVECLVQRKSHHLKTVRMCNWVLSIHPKGTNLPRALASRGLAREALGHYKLAIEDLQCAIKYSSETCILSALQERGRSLQNDDTNASRHPSQTDTMQRFRDKLQRDLRRVKFVLKQVGQVGASPVVLCAGVCANDMPWYAWNNTVVDAVSQARAASVATAFSAAVSTCTMSVRPNIVLLLSLNPNATTPFAQLRTDLGNDRTVTLVHHLNASGDASESFRSLMQMAQNVEGVVDSDDGDNSSSSCLPVLLQGLVESGYCGGLFGASAKLSDWPVGVREAFEQARFDVSQSNTSHPTASFVAWFRQQLKTMRETRKRRPFFAIVAMDDAVNVNPIDPVSSALVSELRRFPNVFEHTVVAAVGVSVHSPLVLSSNSFTRTVAKSFVSAERLSATIATSASVTSAPESASVSVVSPAAASPVLVTRGEDVLPALVRMCTVPAATTVAAATADNASANNDAQGLVDVLNGDSYHGVASGVVATSCYVSLHNPASKITSESTLVSHHDNNDSNARFHNADNGDIQHIAVGAFARAPLSDEQISDALDGAGMPIHVYQLRLHYASIGQSAEDETKRYLFDITEDPDTINDLSTQARTNVMLYHIQRALERVLLQQLSTHDANKRRYAVDDTQEQRHAKEAGEDEDSTQHSGRWAWPGRALTGAAAAIGLTTPAVFASTCTGDVS